MVDLGDCFAHCDYQLEQAVAFYPDSPVHSEIKVWDVLLSMIRAGVPAGEPPQHPAVVKAKEIIEAHLSDRLRVSSLAETCGVSHNQLTRLFQEASRMSVVNYIRSRRAKRAFHLLRFTTRPIKTIAIEVGLPDLQQFNKFVRREWKVGPRALRRQTRGAGKPPGEPQD